MSELFLSLSMGPWRWSWCYLNLLQGGNSGNTHPSPNLNIWMSISWLCTFIILFFIHGNEWLPMMISQLYSKFPIVKLGSRLSGLLMLQLTCSHLVDCAAQRESSILSFLARHREVQGRTLGASSSYVHCVLKGLACTAAWPPHAHYTWLLQLVLPYLHMVSTLSHSQQTSQERSN